VLVLARLTFFPYTTLFRSWGICPFWRVFVYCAVARGRGGLCPRIGGGVCGFSAHWRGDGVVVFPFAVPVATLGAGAANFRGVLYRHGGSDLFLGGYAAFCFVAALVARTVAVGGAFFWFLSSRFNPVGFVGGRAVLVWARTHVMGRAHSCCC